PAIVAARLADVRRYEPRLEREIGENTVHDMRVAIRRLRAALKLFGGRGSQPLQQEVKRLQDALGEVRDVHVQMSWMHRELAARGAPGELARVCEAQRRRLPALEARLRAELRRWQKRVVPKVLAHVESLELEGPLGGNAVRKALKRQLRRIEKRIVRLLDDQDPDGERAHQLRIKLKKLRYQAELVRPAFPRRVDVVLDTLVPFQQLLGELHDVQVRAELLRRTVGSRGRSAQVKALLTRVEEAQLQLAAESSAELDRWQKARVAKALRRTL
ncbi:MAG: CHAD domain-containing protein, partial [Myxococcales bacterium]